MADDAQSAPDAGSGGSFLPPVFTHWSGSKPEVEPASDPVALPFLPDDGAPAEQTAASDEGAAPVEQALPESSAPVFETALSQDFGVADTEAESEDSEAFPIEAFIIPDDSERMPAGFETESLSPSEPISNVASPATLDRTSRLADRLEALARKLRAQGPAALGNGLDSGDRFDAVLAGLLAGYLAAGDE